MTVMLEHPLFGSFMTTCIGLVVFLALYFLKAGIKKRRDEYWNSCLHRLSEYDSSFAVKHWHSGGNKNSASNVKTGLRTVQKIELLRPSISKREKAASGSSDYSLILRSLNINSDKYGLFSGAMKIIGAMIGGGMFYGLQKWGAIIYLNQLEFGAALLLSLIVGSFFPNFLAKKIAKIKQERIEDVAPDVVDLLLLSVEGGMSFDKALLEVKSGLKLYADDLALELEQLSAELKVLPNRFNAFQNLVERTGSDTLRYLTVALSQGEKYGTPIATSLRAVADESRKRKLIELERRAGRLPVLMSVPLMTLILPPVIVASAGPSFVLMMRSLGGAG